MSDGSPPWLETVRTTPSLRARALDAFLRRNVKPGTARLRAVTPAVVRASRARLARLETGARLAAPRVRVETVSMGAVPAERVVAPGARSGRTVFLVHGGAFAVGTPALYRNLAARIAHAAHCEVLVPAYRLAPEHPFPAAVEDVRLAWDWLATRASPASAAIVGDSAGGGLALGLLASLRDADVPLPAAGVALAPWTDLGLTGASLTTNAASDAYLESRLMPDVARLYLAGADQGDPRASPLLGALHDLPPLLLQISDSEILRDDALRYAARAHDAGVAVRVESWSRLPHVFQLFAPLIPESGEAIGRIGVFLGRAWSEARPVTAR